MPTKLGNGGHSYEKYDTNTGKYMSDGIPNKYYDNPNENISSKFDLKEKELDNAIENAIGDSMNLQEYKKSIKEMYNDLPESEYKDILYNYLNNCKKSAFFIGNHAISNYKNGRIEFEFNVINDKDLKVFTHEIGHAINDMHKGNRVGELSSFFKDENDKTIFENIYSDWQKNSDVILNDYKNYEENILKEEFRKNGFIYKTEKEQKLEFENSKTKKKKEIQNKIDKTIIEFQQYAKNKSKEELTKDQFALNLNNDYQNLKLQLKEIENEEFVPTKLQEKELTLKAKILKENIQLKYGNISDAVSSMGIVNGLCNIHHEPSYWNSRDVVADEFFANCFNSLVTNNNQEIELYEKYFPNAFQAVKKALKEINDKIQGEKLYGKLGI